MVQALIESGLPTEALLAQMAVAKYANGLALYRQEAICARDGVDLDRPLMAQWMGKVGFELQPLADYAAEKIKQAERIFADETTLPTLAPGSGKTQRPGCGPLCHTATPRRAALERSKRRPRRDRVTVERAIRPQTITRKNGLFASSGRTWATIATLLQTAKTNDVDPLAWLTQTRERIAQGWPISQIDALMPWHFKPWPPQLGAYAVRGSESEDVSNRGTSTSVLREDCNRRAAELPMSSGRSIRSVAKELGLRDSVLRRGVEKLRQQRLLGAAPACRSTCSGFATSWSSAPTGGCNARC